MNFRLFSSGLLLSSFFLLPWWVTAIFGAAFLLLFPLAFEVVFLAFVADLLFHPKPESFFFEGVFLLTSLSLLLLLFSRILRERTRFIAY